MKAKLISTIALLCLAGSAFAAERAVESVHYQIDAAAEFFDSEGKGRYPEDSKSIAETLHGEVNLPIGPYLGASVATSFAKYNDENDDARIKYEDETIRGVAQLYYRIPTVGRLSFGYAREWVDYTYSYYSSKSSGSETTNSYLALVEGYVGPVTLALHGERRFYDSGFGPSVSSDLAWASVQWYVVPRARVGLEVGLRDAKDAYLAEIEFQPEFFGNMAGIYVGYMRADNDQAEVNGVRLGVNFYFNKRFDLRTRDRQYR